MPTRRIPAYRHHKARHLAVVRLDGKDIYLGPYDSPGSRSKYDRLVADWLRRNNLSPEDGANITLCELMAAYLNFASGYYLKCDTPTREFGCISEALRELRKLHETTLVPDFGPKALKAVRGLMVDLGWSRKYVNKQIGRIVRMFKWGVSEELVPPAVYQAVATVSGLRKGRTIAPDHQPVQPVSDAHIDLTLRHLTPTVADMVRLQRLCSARPGEIVRLRPIDIDRSQPIWAYRPDKHKTEHQGKERVVFFGPRAQELLRRYLDRPVNSFCFSPRESEALRRQVNHARRTTPMNQGNTPKSTSWDGKRRAAMAYTTGSYRRAIHRVCEKIGIPKWSPNQIRHTAATEIRRKYGLEAAQAVLGHSHAAVTEIYAERDLTLASAIAEQLG